ncbi:MAG: hypothetical protein U0736_26595 [Gemmataceae bacterium]
MRAKRLTIKQRKEIFHQLVLLQDAGLCSTAESIQQISQQYGIDENQVRQITDEGLEKDWLEEAYEPVE